MDSRWRLSSFLTDPSERRSTANRIVTSAALATTATAARDAWFAPVAAGRLDDGIEAVAALLDELPVVISEWDPDRVLRYANRAATDFLRQWGVADVVGRRLHEIGAHEGACRWMGRKELAIHRFDEMALPGLGEIHGGVNDIGWRESGKREVVPHTRERLARLRRDIAPVRVGVSEHAREKHAAPGAHASRQRQTGRDGRSDDLLLACRGHERDLDERL